MRLRRPPRGGTSTTPLEVAGASPSASAKPMRDGLSVPRLVRMTSITAFALRHRLLIVLGWLALTAIGAVTVSSATGRLSHTFATPGNPGYDANQRIDAAL